MARAQIYRQVMQAACASCGAEWFGSGGEAAARQHAQTSGHQVQLQIWHRETINPVGASNEPQYAAQMALSDAELALSFEASKESVSLFAGPIGRHNRRVAS